MAHPIESELIKITGYKTRTKFSDRQDYLGSILNAVMKLTDDDFENLTDGAAEWANAAVHAKNTKEDIPDFDEAVATDGESEDDDDDATDDEAEAEDEPDSDDDAGDGDVPDSAPDSADDDDTDGDVEDDEEVDDEVDDEVEDDEPEPEPEPKPKKKVAAAPVHKMKVPPPEPKRERVTKKKLHNRNPRAHEDEDVVLDKWGCMEGSKNSRALAMFEKGATAKEIKDSLGGTYYNILKKMVQDGHTVEKEGAVIKLIHQSEKGKKPVAAKPVAKAPVKKKK